MQMISGNTYPFRGEIKRAGGRWDPRAKAWIVPDDKAEEIRVLVNGVSQQVSGRGVYTRFSGGGEVFRNARGRCEDAPCCGCCSA